MGASNSHTIRTISSRSHKTKSNVNPLEKTEEAFAARRAKDFNSASFLYEEAAVASEQAKEPPGISASYYLEAANCAEAFYEETNSEKSNNHSTSDSSPPAEVEAGMRRVMLMLENAATQYGKANRSHEAANVYKRMAILYEEELHDSQSASKYFEQASTDYNSANFFNNAVDCDLQQANVTLRKNPLQSLGIFKKVVNKLVKKQQITSARPIVYKIVLLTGSLYDVNTAKKAAESYILMNRTFSACADLRRLQGFLHALEEEDAERADHIIEETLDPWAKDILIKMKQDSLISDEINMK